MFSIIIPTFNNLKYLVICINSLKNRVKYFCGDNENVFNRTLKCVEKFKFKYLVRICADRPLFDVDVMIQMIRLIVKKKLDIVTNSNPRTYPKGLTCEVAKTNIFKINQKKLNTSDKEHIFNYFYKNKNFKIYNITDKFSKKFLNTNFCLDSKKDLKKIRNILSKFSKMKKEITTDLLYEFY